MPAYWMSNTDADLPFDELRLPHPIHTGVNRRKPFENNTKPGMNLQENNSNYGSGLNDGAQMRQPVSGRVAMTTSTS